MGWTGTPCDSKPSNREINRMVQQWMETPTCRIIDRSEWQAHGRHQFLLMEAEPRVETEKAIRFIVVILVEYHQHQLLYKEVEESMGPNELGQGSGGEHAKRTGTPSHRGIFRQMAGKGPACRLMMASCGTRATRQLSAGIKFCCGRFYVT